MSITTSSATASSVSSSEIAGRLASLEQVLIEFEREADDLSYRAVLGDGAATQRLSEVLKEASDTDGEGCAKP